MADAVVTVAEVNAFMTQSGNRRFVLRDEKGASTRRSMRRSRARRSPPRGAARASTSTSSSAAGSRTSTLDRVQPLDERAGEASSEAVEEVAWKTAVDAAPWLLGGEPEERVPPEELFELLQPLKERVADDIRGDSAAEGEPG